jgi:hypothetical protein
MAFKMDLARQQVSNSNSLIRFFITDVLTQQLKTISSDSTGT